MIWFYNPKPALPIPCEKATISLCHFGWAWFN